MSNSKLRDRVENYSENCNFKLMNRVPLIITVNGRSFSKVTSLLDKPFSIPFAECMYSTLIRLGQEIDGATFGYSFNDEIVIVVRNDQNLDTTAWYDNSVQKVASVVSSIATLHFNNCVASVDLNLMGDPVFITNIYTVPNLTEAINVMVCKQQQAFQTAIQQSCLYEMLKKYDKNSIKEMIAGLTNDEKINFLYEETGVDFNDYQSAFKRGVACYRSPKTVHFEGMETVKNKWILNTEIPIFTKEHSFLGQIFKKD